MPAVGKRFLGAQGAFVAVVQGVAARQSDFAGESRPAEGYIGYTYHHLPKFPRNTDAMPASFAARMAFSNFWIRWLLK